MSLNAKTKEKWKHIILFTFLLFIIVVLSNSVRKVYNKKKSAEETLVRMQLEAVDLERRQKLLENMEDRLSTKEGLEFELKKKFNVVRQGESVAIVVESENNSSGSNKADSVWQKIKSFFGSMFE
ncbi:MAG: hypothetical protein AAB392_00665 [Patescibacteria group bacterium]